MGRLESLKNFRQVRPPSHKSKTQQRPHTFTCAQFRAVVFPGEVIMVTQNDAGAEVFNSDVAVVLPDAHGEPCMARLLESGRDVPLVLLPAYKTAFAMTIHKSQGSEFGTVLHARRCGFASSST